MYTRLKRAVLMLCGVAAAVIAQETVGDKFTVPLTDPNRPVQLQVSLHGARLTVKGGAIKNVVVESSYKPEEDEDREDSGKRHGLRRIPNLSSGLSIEEENNEVTVSSGRMNDASNLHVTVNVPSLTSAKLSLINGDDIIVEGITGELEVSCTNGGITMKNVGGSVVANAINGHLSATMTTVSPGKPMSFSSLNGDIDVTFPPDIKANVSLKADMQGEIFTDFDVKIESQPAKVEGNERDRKGRYRVTVDRTMRGTVNGGGPEYTFKSFQGDIYIRKKK
ncbi:MAG TPA: hypothetical protein DCX46_04620 [Bacteroidetes bacterium]|nr:hypothetical protein [Bacteroidota bacterium]